jgi:hypothetical protein
MTKRKKVWGLGLLLVGAGVACTPEIRELGDEPSAGNGGSASGGSKAGSASVAANGGSKASIPEAGASGATGATSSTGGGGPGSMGGQPPNLDDCESVPPAPVILACAHDLGTPIPLFPPFDTVTMVSVPNGQVSSETVGALEDGCLAPLLLGWPNKLALLAQATSWTVTEGDRVFVVEVVVEGNQMPSLDGQKVSLTYFHEPGEFSPTRRELSMVTLTSPTHGVWMAEGGDLPELGNLPLQLSRSKTVCSRSAECGSYERYDIDAFEPLTTSTVSVQHGQTSKLGPWDIVHGGYAEQTSDGGSCLDWFVADVHVAILGSM